MDRIPIDPRLAALLRGWNRRRITRTFITGMAAVLPILVTFALVMWMIGAAETMLGGLLRVLLPGESYRPGMGLIFTVVVIFVAGLLMQALFFRGVVRWMEEQLERIPLIKTVYGAVRDLTGFFSKEGKSQFGKVVMVQLPNLPFRLVGFITVDNLAAVGMAQSTDVDTVAVYLPMSYQIGGYTILLPRSCLVEVDMTFEEAMRFLITAGVSHSAHTGASTPPPTIVTPPVTT